MRKDVAVIDNYKVTSTGVTDEKLVDKYYMRVNGELRFAGALIRLEDKELVSRLLIEQQAIIDAAEKRQWCIQTIFNDIFNNGVNSTNYPDIRKQEWFKAIDPKNLQGSSLVGDQSTKTG